MSVESFRLDPTDLTANTYPNIVEDPLNGGKCALIKIQTTQKGFQFDNGTLGIGKVVLQNEAHPAEIWLYLPDGTSWLTIQHPVHGSITRYDLGGRLKGSKTYILKLTADDVSTLVLDYDHLQNAVIKVYPTNAVVTLNGMRHTPDASGTVSLKELPCGVHTYRITAPLYHPAEGKMTLTQKKPGELSVRLKQAFGYLDIPAEGDAKDAIVLCDSTSIGSVPLSRHPVASGEHLITVKKKLYYPFTQTVTVKDSASVSVVPALKSNSAVIEFGGLSDKEAEIYLDGEKLGATKWKGLVEGGEHKVIVRKLYHKDFEKIITVKNGVAQTVTLSPPKPIYGSLHVSANAPMADVYIDGVRAGNIPYINTELLIGPHKVTVKKAGYRDEEARVFIKEGERQDVSFDMVNYCRGTITSSPRYAYVRINGQYIGVTPCELDLLAGDYKIEVSAGGHTSVTKNMYLDGNTPDSKLFFKLNRNYIWPKELYLQVGADAMDFSLPSAGLGFYIKNVNVEGNFIYGLSDSGVLVWNDMSGYSLPCKATYTPWGWDAKLGYGIRINSRLRITPQIGVRQILLKQTLTDFDVNIYDDWTYSTSNYYLCDGANAFSGTVGARFNVAIINHLGLSVTPEYRFAVMQSDGYKVLSDFSTKIKGYINGFGVNVNLNVFF